MWNNRRAQALLAFALLFAGSTSRSFAQNQPAGAGAQTLDEVIKSLDKDGDGKISKAEATGSFAQRFANWDSNSDGFATREEIQAFRKQRGIGDDGQRLNATGGNNSANSARRPAAAANKIVKEPADWREEQFPLPPGFAPDVVWKGAEECRFSPGMYDTSSREYLTYAMALTLDGSPEIMPAEFKKFLESYFRGLSTVVARRSGSKPDTSRIVATVTASPDSKTKLLAEMVFIDSFTDGRETKLLIEADVAARPAEKKTYVMILVSPSARDSETWKKLREVGATAAKNIP